MPKKSEYTPKQLEIIAEAMQVKRNKYIQSAMDHGEPYQHLTKTGGESGYIYKGKYIPFEVRIFPTNICKMVYNGDLPPWHESL